MRVLIAMTYYRPYVSGPISYVESLGRELVARGHEVTVLTSRHDRSLPRRERIAGLDVVRAPVLARVSKGVVSPAFTVAAPKLIRDHDVVVIQVPQLEAPWLALVARRMGRAAVLTYHCDVDLPPGLFNRVIGKLLDVGHRYAARRSDRIVAYTSDYAAHSRVMRHHLDKVLVLAPPVELPEADATEGAAFRRHHGLDGRPLVGICARLSAEKGFDRLIDALPALVALHPDLCVVHAGETEAVAGEGAYRTHIEGRLRAWPENWVSAGVLHGRELASFYAACDVTVLPSVNSTEAFGLVQVESMINGTPVVASELPGVRVPVQTTGMGRLIPTAGTEPLVDAIDAVLAEGRPTTGGRAGLGEWCSPAAVAATYERLFVELGVRS